MGTDLESEHPVCLKEELKLVQRMAEEYPVISGDCNEPDVQNKQPLIFRIVISPFG